MSSAQRGAMTMTSEGETAGEEEEGAGGTVGLGVGCLCREAERGPGGAQTAPERKGGSRSKGEREED